MAFAHGIRGHDLIDAEAFAGDGERVGSVACLWGDAPDHPTYLGVRGGWHGVGRVHVVPMRLVQIDESGDVVRLTCPVATMRDAPTYDPDAAIEPAAAAAIEAYYR